MVQSNNGSMYMATGPAGSVSVSLADLIAESGLANPSMDELTEYWASQSTQISPQTTLPGNISMTTYYTDSGPRRTFWENTDAGPVPLSRSNNSTLRQLELFLKAGRYDNPLENPTDAVIAEAINTFSAQNEYGLSSPSQPQGGFVQGKDLPTGVPPGMEDQWFMRDPRGGLSAWQPPEQSPLTLEQQIGQMVSQGNFEAARQLNEMKRAFNEKRMTQEEIADRASRLAQTPQEMQAWMSAMTGSTGPTPGGGTSWGSAYPPASMSQVIEQFKQIMATQPTPETTPDQEQPSIADSVGAVPGDDEDIVDADTTGTMSARMTAADMQSLRDEYEESLKPTPVTGGILSRSKETRDRLERRRRALQDAMIAGEDEILDVPIMPGGILSRPEETALRFARKEEPSRTYIRREPGRRPTIGVRPDPILPGDISFAEASRMSEEERVLREQDAAMKRLAALGPMDIEEYGLGGGDEAELDIIRRREEILGRPFALYRTPGATGTVKLSRFESTPEERAFIERTGGINPANLTVSASNQVQYHGVGGELSPLRYREPRPELFYGSEEEELLQEEPRMAAMPSRSIRDIERSISRSRALQSPSGTPLVTPSEEELHLLEEDRAASLGRQEASRMFDPRDVTLEDAQRTAQARMRMLGYRPTDLEIPPTDVVDEDVAVPTTIFGISRPTGLETFDRMPRQQYYEPDDEGIMTDPLSPDRIRQLRRRYGSGYPTYTPAGQAARDVIPGLGDKIVDIDERKTNKKPIGSFQYGGVVDEDGAYNLHQGEIVVNPFERFPSLTPSGHSGLANPYKPMSQASWQQIRQDAAGAPATEITVNKNVLSSKTGLGTRPTTMMGAQVSQDVAPEYGEFSQEEDDAMRAANRQRRLEGAERREERRRQRELERQRKQNELSGKDMGGASGGGRFFAGSQIIPYADTAARLKALQTTGLSRQQAAMFDQAERERSMAGQQRFVRRGGKRRTYG